MSSPANRTALREEENRPAPPSQQVSASPVTGPTPYSRAVSSAAPLVPRRGPAAGGGPGPAARRHVSICQRGGHLQLPGWRQLRGRGPQRRGALGGPSRCPAMRGALVEQHRVDPLHPPGVLCPQVLVELEQRPALQDLRRRDPALRQPALASSSRRCRASALSVLARRFGPRRCAVSAGSARCGVSPAAAISSAMYRQPVQPSIANAASYPANRASHSPGAPGRPGRSGPRRTSRSRYRHSRM